MHRKRALFAAAATLLLLNGCGGGQTVEGSEGQSSISLAATGKSDDKAKADADAGPYEAPPFADSSFHSDLAEGSETVRLDLSATADGYVAVSAVSEHRLKFQVSKDETTYTYDVSSDGTPSVFPLQCGDGSYRFQMLENVVDSKYAEIYSTEQTVTLSDEFQPFLRPSDYVSYTPDSQCVKKAAELARTAGDELGLVSAVYEFVCDSVTYDRDKAANVSADYLPDPDETLKSGKGICFDYASLAGAMLRSQGIPTKEIFGYVSPDGLYHAWNMFYTEETGWVTVSYEARGNTWTRLDLTFAAGGADAEFIGDGSNYSDVYFY